VNIPDSHDVHGSNHYDERLLRMSDAPAMVAVVKMSAKFYTLTDKNKLQTGRL
jgi:hypothetical protein